LKGYSDKDEQAVKGVRGGDLGVKNGKTKNGRSARLNWGIGLA
jgi:hypothetical protein